MKNLYVCVRAPKDVTSLLVEVHDLDTFTDSAFYTHDFHAYLDTLQDGTRVKYQFDYDNGGAHLAEIIIHKENDEVTLEYISDEVVKSDGFGNLVK